ncbi:hypothetical protein Dform_00462 [Dehalogenimonas formicexedens]|uniref:Uncharacterized protein n=1 Tax=Dehalogenimonas formicexedens TaxID=1839801 RepID=A0A1P8F5V8_9CHLR|nr:hypothetical protein [Dehalogenimonas formicexedens]APV43818.1 hypothetical protein Dform_00462 [Dehalogenimonas formicexedens]
MNQNTGTTKASPQQNTAQPEIRNAEIRNEKPETPAAGRHEGSQPGNQKARIHGFYSKYAATPRQEVMEEAAQLEGLDAEIVLLRSKIELLEELDPENIKLFSEVIGKLSLIMVRRKYTGQNAVFEKAKKIISILGGAAGVAGGVAEIIKE